MNDIRHRVGIAAPEARVFWALTSTEGLAGWWTREVEGDPSASGTVRFFFGNPDPSAVMEVIELLPDHHVEWRCVEGPNEWLGTRLVFDLRETGTRPR